MNVVGANAYLSATAKAYAISPLVEKLKDALDDWAAENECVRALDPYAPNIPANLVEDYVWALTHTYVGYMGSSGQYSRRDFYANAAASLIPSMFAAFDDNAASAFVDTVKSSEILRRRIQSPAKLDRLRSLANIVLERASNSFSGRKFIQSLVDEKRVEEFLKQLS